MVVPDAPIFGSVTVQRISAPLPGCPQGSPSLPATQSLYTWTKANLNVNNNQCLSGEDCFSVEYEVPGGDYVTDITALLAPAADVPPESPKECLNLYGLYDLAYYVDTHNGAIPCSIANDYFAKYPANSNYHGGLWFAGQNAAGHYYLEINPIYSFKTQDPALVAASLKQSIGMIFPFGITDYNTGKITNSTIELGHHYGISLVLFGGRVRIGEGHLNVICSESSAYHFTFTAVPGAHILEGSALHGIFVDDDGRIWMFQQGRGVPNESWLSRYGSRIFAYEWMWDRLADNLTEELNM